MYAMSPGLLAYPFIFLAIFFEVFVLVTLLSKPARLARARAKSVLTPSVAVIVPCYNEDSTIAGTVESLFALDYPASKLEIILVNDGSTDGTREAMDRFASHQQVRVIHKENGGKHTALNLGIASTEAEFIGCLDADSFVEPDALRHIIASFTNNNVAATTAAMSIHNPRKLIEHMQNAEYSFGITARHAIASINGLHVTPGPFSFYRHSVIKKLGGFRYAHQTEDMEMALRIQEAGYEIENAPQARVYTKAPKTIKTLIKQRVRWTTGFLRNILGEYRGLIFNHEYGVLGMLILPSAVLSVGSGILLFVYSMTQLIYHSVTAVQFHAGVPLLYALTPRYGQLDWFYLPTNVLVLLGLITLGVSLLLIVFGRYISKTPMRLTLGLISYALAYGLIAPLWLLRATADVAIGKQRIWK
jgi:cellulose synthase/poly-beta-1,6-N-acetylglucosamine synthase-like glycosyltransferase